MKIQKVEKTVTYNFGYEIEEPMWLNGQLESWRKAHQFDLITLNQRKVIWVTHIWI